ncbi:MAG: hypothetical protein AABX31_04270 [Nanoarchaeota archaeon]
MSKKNFQKEIEEAQKKVRGEEKKTEPPGGKKPEQKNDSEKLEKASEKKEVEEILEKEEELDEEQFLTEREQQQKSRKETGLEDIARKGSAPAEVHDSQYVERLSHRPIGELYKEVKQLYQIAEDKGYLSPTEQKQVEYLSSAVQRKFEDEEEGIYSFSEQAARAASITQQLSASMIGSYKGKKMNEMYKN